MNKLFLDIETIPVEKEKYELLENIYNQKKAVGKNPGTFEEFLAGTGLDGAFGRIACISYAFNDDKPKTISGKESLILQKFWEVAKTADLFIGFNILDFDLRFIYQRSVILGVRPTLDLNFARYRSSPIFDVMREWSKWESHNISLDTLAKALGLKSSKDGAINGSNVEKAYEEGRLKEIYDYCERDVELTRKIYNRLTFRS